MSKILKLRPVAKTPEEIEEEKKLIFVLPRKTCAQMIPELVRIKTETTSHELQHRMHILKKLMKIARIKEIDKKLEHITQIDEAEKVIPHGEVSKRLYNDIFVSRDFDLYGRMMKPTTHPPRKHLELAVLAQKLGIEFTQKADQYYKEIHSDEESDDEDTRRKEKLRTEKWKIGYMKHHNPPVGLADNPARAFNSLGNEYFYSYDGEWKAGRMDGAGVYLFRDGKTYEGRFVEGKQHGEGTAHYPGGQKYVGSWKDGRYCGRGETFTCGGSKYVGDFEFGRRHGHGTLTFPSGLSYEGEFLDGKPHGRGVMTSALSGWSYNGSFEL